MKILFTLLILGSVFSGKAQLIQYLDNNPVWKITRESGECPSGGEHMYYLSGDTLLNNKLYYKVYSKGYSWQISSPNCPTSYHFSYQDSVPRYYIRQDNQKLFKYDAGCGEVLLYDFGLQAGDTVKSYYGCQSYNSAVVDSVDSVLIAGSYRRVLHLDPNNCSLSGATRKVIEGIGTEHDLFQFCNNNYDSFGLQCYGLNGQFVYSETGDSCELDIHLGIKEPKYPQPDIQIFPNPSSDHVTISIPGQEYYTLEVDIYDLSGKKVYTGQNNGRIDVSDLSPGLYLIKVILNDSSVVTKQLLKNQQ